MRLYILAYLLGCACAQQCDTGNAYARAEKECEIQGTQLKSWFDVKGLSVPAQLTNMVTYLTSKGAGCLCLLEDWAEAFESCTVAVRVADPNYAIAVTFSSITAATRLSSTATKACSLVLAALETSPSPEDDESPASADDGESPVSGDDQSPAGAPSDKKSCKKTEVSVSTDTDSDGDVDTDTDTDVGDCDDGGLKSGHTVLIIIGIAAALLICLAILLVVRKENKKKKQYRRGPRNMGFQPGNPIALGDSAAYSYNSPSMYGPPSVFDYPPPMTGASTFGPGSEVYNPYDEMYY